VNRRLADERARELAVRSQRLPRASFKDEAARCVEEFRRVERRRRRWGPVMLREREEREADDVAVSC
jgi:hypothetical protein